ncbi:hypothetical protein QOT17_014263 [Balamuthia mandrillaris]
MVTRKKSNESDLEYEERLRKVMVEEFGRRMEYAKAHYFKAECDRGCPCQESRNVDLESMDRCAPITSLPPEMIYKIITYLEGKEFGSFSSACKFFLAVGRQQRQKLPNNKKKLEYYDDGGDVEVKKKIEKVIAMIDAIILKAELFVHGYHTCHNENLNMCRTTDTPKAKSFPTFTSRAMLSPLRRNMGGRGSALLAVWKEIGLDVSTQVQHHFEKLDNKEQNNRKRKKSKEYKKREKELQQQRVAKAIQEKKTSKQRGDEYLENHRKSLNPVFEEALNNASPVDLSTASTTGEQSEEGIASSEKEKTTRDLSVPKVTTIEEEELLRYNGDNTVEGQKKRLAAYITDPSGNVPFLTLAKQRELSELGLCRN